MNNYIAAVFKTEADARRGLHALWELDLHGAVTVHGAALVRRDAHGHVNVATKQSDLGLRTAIGVGIGTLLGALAGPIGAAAGAAIGASTVGIGAAAGAGIGLIADGVVANEHEEAVGKARFVLGRGEAAVIAEVSEGSTFAIDTAMQQRGGTVHRRSKDQVRRDAFDDGFHDTYLYTYEYDPAF